MTSRQLYQALLIELNKVHAPTILLEDFNYAANVAIYHYINKKYNAYDTSQQFTDDLRELKETIILTPKLIHTYDSLDLIAYEAILPSDYLHILNCICVYNVINAYKCLKSGCTCKYKATKLTADAYSQVLDNYRNRPSYKRPYYYIHNVGVNDTVPTNPYSEDGSGTDFNSIVELGTDGNGNPIVTGEGTPKTIKIKVKEEGQIVERIISNVERGAEIRYGNVFQVRLEIRYENDNSKVELKQVYIDYLKTPQNILLTQEQLDKVEDTSQMLEFPDYVCHEIVNELVHIVMENMSDQRLQTHPVVSQSIANPTQQQTQENL